MQSNRNRGKFPGRLRNAQLIRSPSVVQVLDIVIPRICEIEMLHLLARKSAPVTPSGSQSSLRQGAPARLLLTTAAAGPIEPPPDPRLVALSRLDHLPLAEKLALFA